MRIMLSTDPIVEKYLKMALENPEVPFTYDGVRFINIKRLYDFVHEKLKPSFVDFEEVLKEVIESAGDGGTYELGRHETKSGNPEIITFEHEVQDDENNDVIEGSEKIIF